MKAIRTVKVRLGGSAKLDAMLGKYIPASNWVSERALAGKETNSNRLQKAFYAAVREKFKLPSQITCSTFRSVAASYKSQKTLNTWSLCRFRSPVIPLTSRRCLIRKSGGLTVFGEFFKIHEGVLPKTTWKDSRVKRVGKVWFLLLVHEVDIKEPKTEGCIVGVDMGIKRLLVATNSRDSKTFFFKGGVLNHRRTCIRRTRASVQSVGTRSSRRLLRRMSGHEAAVTGHILHVASKALVGYAVEVGARRIVLEDLSNIRDASLNKGKDLRSKVHRWPYAEVRFKVGYKAAAAGIDMELVNPRNTSRGCNACGHVSASNRKGLHFHCGKCGHCDDADRNASKNIRARSICLAHDARKMGRNKTPESSELPEVVSESFVLHGDFVAV